MYKFIIAFLLLFVSTAQAETIKIDISKLDADTATKVLQQSKSITPEQVQPWLGIGKEIAAAFSDTAKGLSMSVNEFANTPVGFYATLIIVYYVVGAKLLKLLIAFILFPFLALLWFKSMRRFFWAPDRYKFQGDGVIGCSIAHFAFAFIWLIGFLLAVFV